MGSTLAAAHSQSEVNSLDLPLMGAARRVPVGDAPEGGDWLVQCAARAVDRVMSRKQAAIVMGMDQAQMTRQFTGNGHLSMRRFGVLGDDVMRAFLDELRDHFGLQSEAERLDRALDGLTASVQVIADIARKAVQR